MKLGVVCATYYLSTKLRNPLSLSHHLGSDSFIFKIYHLQFLILWANYRSICTVFIYSHKVQGEDPKCSKDFKSWFGHLIELAILIHEAIISLTSLWMLTLFFQAFPRELEEDGYRTFTTISHPHLILDFTFLFLLILIKWSLISVIQYKSRGILVIFYDLTVLIFFRPVTYFWNFLFMCLSANGLSA